MALSIEDGVLFSDSSLPGRPLGEIHVEVNRQNATLVDIKRELAWKAKGLGANAVAQFRYFQRGHKSLENLALKWDTESQVGTGQAVFIPRDRMQDAVGGATE